MSEAGESVLVEVEGEVLRAYRDIAGYWTIGLGLTASSGVITPKAGMVITKAESRRLLRLALSRNYEPRVVKALGTDKQNVFDGATLFDWNTGAITRASWVPLFLKGAVQSAMQSFLTWNKAGGKVVAGLQTRRRREWDIIEFANYGSQATSGAGALSSFSDYADALGKLGYMASLNGGIAAIKAFQRDQKLTVDGLIGPATRASIQRALQAKTTHQAAVGAGATGGTVGVGADVATNSAAANPVDLETLLWLGGGIAAAVAIVYGASIVWRHRGPLFAWLPEPVKNGFESAGIVIGRPIRS